MHKQELIGCYERVLNFVPQNEQRIYRKFIKQINELDETQKPVVLQFVDDWYKDNKDDLDYALFSYVHLFNMKEETDFKEWFNKNDRAFQTIVNMHQFGYTIKDEDKSKYYVKLKGISDNSCVLKYHEDTNRWIMGTTTHFKEARVYHTKEQLEEAGFSNVFDNPMFEVEEVE